MNHTLQMTALLRQLVREKNGEVVDNMERRGISYPLNYGVSLPTIKQIVVQCGCGTDDALARFLYQQQVRELKLAAFFIADATALAIDNLPFWTAGIKNAELAENFASALLAKSSIVREAVGQMISSDDTMQSYAALVCVVKAPDAFTKAEKDAFVERYLSCSVPLLESAADRLYMQLNY